MCCFGYQLQKYEENLIWPNWWLFLSCFLGEINIAEFEEIYQCVLGDSLGKSIGEGLQIPKKRSAGFFAWFNLLSGAQSHDLRADAEIRHNGNVCYFFENFCGWFVGVGFILYFCKVKKSVLHHYMMRCINYIRFFSLLTAMCIMFVTYCK